MLVVPVIDISAGQVVHARAGRRDSYAAIRSSLCQGSNPASVVEALMGIYPFPVLYIADLDAIKESGNNNAIIEELSRSHPALHIWLDAGMAGFDQGCLPCGSRQVIGSETGIGPDELEALCAKNNAVLSLDFLANKLVGDQSLLENCHTWPADVIVMSLDRVGMASGPDYARLEQVLGMTRQARVHAAGGIDNAKDMASLKERGLAGTLLASALHNGNIRRRDIERIVGCEK